MNDPKNNAKQPKQYTFTVPPWLEFTAEAAKIHLEERAKANKRARKKVEKLAKAYGFDAKRPEPDPEFQDGY